MENQKSVQVGDYVRVSGRVMRVEGVLRLRAGQIATTEGAELLSPEEGKRLHHASRGDDEATVIWGT